MKLFNMLAAVPVIPVHPNVSKELKPEKFWHELIA
jgi:hypothetical protein